MKATSSKKKSHSYTPLNQTCGCIQHKKWCNYKKPEDGKKLKVAKIGSRHFSPAVVKEMLKDYLTERVLCDSCHAYYKDNLFTKNASNNRSTGNKTSSPINRNRQSLLERCGCKKHSKWWNYLKDDPKNGGRTVLAISSKTYLKSVVERMKQAKLIRNSYLCKSCYSYLKDNWESEKEKMATIVETQEIEDSNCFDLNWDLEIDPPESRSKDKQKKNQKDTSVDEEELLLSTEKFVDPCPDENNNLIVNDLDENNNLIVNDLDENNNLIVNDLDENNNLVVNDLVERHNEVVASSQPEQQDEDVTNHANEGCQQMTDNAMQEQVDGDGVKHVEKKDEDKNRIIEQGDENLTQLEDLQMGNDEDITEDICTISVDIEMETLVTKMDVDNEVSCDVNLLGKLLTLIGTKVLKNELKQNQAL